MRVPALMLLSLLLSFAQAQAKITRLEVLRTEPAFGGQSFGDVGPYQHVVARVQGELDPTDPRNAVIQDLDLAPRDGSGLVHYETEVELLKPADQSRGNRVLMFEVNNRGNKLALGAFNAAVPPGIEARRARRRRSSGSTFVCRVASNPAGSTS